MGEIVPAAAPSTTPPADGAKPAEDVLDIVLEGVAAPVKVPVSKIPLDKLQPHLAKHRAEADRRMSEADKLSKDTAAKWGPIQDLAARAKDDPAVLEELALKLGIPEKVLELMSEKNVAKSIERQLRKAEEEQDPGKKAAREQAEETERLRKENDDLKKKNETTAHAQLKARVENIIVQGLEKLPEKLRSPHAAQEMVAFLRASLDAKSEELKRDAGLDDLTITMDDVVRAARDGWKAASLRYLEADEDGELPEWLVKRVEAAQAKKAGTPRHPSAGGGGTSKGPPKAAGSGKDTEPPANRILGMLRMT